MLRERHRKSKRRLVVVRFAVEQKPAEYRCVVRVKSACRTKCWIVEICPVVIKVRVMTGGGKERLVGQE